MVSPPSLANPHDAHLPPSRLSTTVQRLGVGAFVLGLVVVALFLLTEHWRRGTFAFGMCLLWLTGLRCVADGSVMGVLSVRSRRFDALYTGLLGALMIYFSVSVDSLGS